MKLTQTVLPHTHIHRHNNSHGPHPYAPLCTHNQTDLNPLPPLATHAIKSFATICTDFNTPYSSIHLSVYYKCALFLFSAVFFFVCIRELLWDANPPPSVRASRKQQNIILLMSRIANAKSELRASITIMESKINFCIVIFCYFFSFLMQSR